MPAATRSPSGVSGRSVVEVCRPSRLHSVSPWRTSQTSSYARHGPHHGGGGRCVPRCASWRRPPPTTARRCSRVTGGPRPALSSPRASCSSASPPGCPTVQDHWGYSDTTLSLLLLMMVLLAGLGSVLAETACKRVDSAAILRVGLLGIAVAVPVFALAPDQAGLHRLDGALRRRPRRGGRDDQHAGGRARAPLRPADPAVVPRSLDPRRAASARPWRSRWATCRSRRPRPSPCCRW